MAFGFIIEEPLGALPGDVNAALQERLHHIAAILDVLPSGALWSSLEAGGLILDVSGWRFRYRVDRKRQAVIVEQALLDSE